MNVTVNDKISRGIATLLIASGVALGASHLGNAMPSPEGSNRSAITISATPIDPGTPIPTEDVTPTTTAEPTTTPDPEDEAIREIIRRLVALIIEILEKILADLRS